MRRINISVVLAPAIDIFVMLVTFLVLSENFLYRSAVKG